MQKALLIGGLTAAAFLGFFVPTFLLVVRGLTNQESAALASIDQPTLSLHHVIVASSSSLVSPNTPGASGVVDIGGKTFIADIAADPASRALGLSYRENLPADTVKLFVFPAASNWGFWMKGMNFPLDIIWLDQSGAVVYLKKNLATSTYPNTFAPPASSPALYVIEANAGTATQLGIGVGSIISLPTGLTAK